MYSAVPVNNQGDRGELLDRISPEKAVELFRHRLLGEEYKNGKWEAIPALAKYKLTEEGAWEIANLMLSVSTINISISRMSEDAVKQRAFRIAKTAQKMLLYNWRRYGIKSVAQFHFVHEVVFTNTLAVLYQAKEGSIQNLVADTTQEVKTVKTEPENTTSRIKRILGMN